MTDLLAQDDWRDEPYWQQDAANDRDERDQHLRHVEQDERERLEEKGA